jgi:hypothetical protein
LTLQRVPKALGTLRAVWAPAAMVVSFKLETDEALLAGKAAGAVAAYGVHLVVGNMLHTRKERVYLVEPAAGGRPDGGGEAAVTVRQLDRLPGEAVIEQALVVEVVAMHRRHIAG